MEEFLKLDKFEIFTRYVLLKAHLCLEYDKRESEFVNFHYGNELL